MLVCKQTDDAGVQINVKEGNLLSLECEVAGVKPIGKPPSSALSASVLLTLDVCWFHEGEPLRVDGTESISTHLGQNASKTESSVQELQPTPSKHQILLHQVHDEPNAFDQTDR